MSKNIPISVRVPQEDAEFLAQLQMEGASTPSDKVRALLADARRRHQGFQDYAGCLGMAHEMVAPTLNLLRDLEQRSSIHSEPVAQLADWLPETLAFFLTAFPDDGEHNDLAQIEALERGVTDRVFRLVQKFLRLGVTDECQAYDPRVVSNRLEPTLEVADLIRRGRNPKKEES
ncbi:MAG: hypothetical protein AAF430_07350 [Myxococcota bacterium]